MVHRACHKFIWAALIGVLIQIAAPIWAVSALAASSRSDRRCPGLLGTQPTRRDGHPSAPARAALPDLPNSMPRGLRRRSQPTRFHCSGEYQLGLPPALFHCRAPRPTARFRAAPGSADTSLTCVLPRPRAAPSRWRSVTPTAVREECPPMFSSRSGAASALTAIPVIWVNFALAQSVETSPAATAPDQSTITLPPVSVTAGRPAFFAAAALRRREQPQRPARHHHRPGPVRQPARLLDRRDLAAKPRASR